MAIPDVISFGDDITAVTDKVFLSNRKILSLVRPQRLPSGPNVSELSSGVDDSKVEAISS